MSLLDLLTFPVTGPIYFVVWLAEKIAEQMDNEYYSEEAIRRQLMELEMKFDMGEISEEDYMAAEEMLLALMKRVRELKAAQLQEAQGQPEDEA
jgi:hypothetical protein